MKNYIKEAYDSVLRINSSRITV